VGSNVSELFEAQEALADKVITLERLEKRQALHLELADALRPLLSDQEIGAVAARLLGREFGAHSVALVDVDEGLGVFDARVYCGQAPPTGRLMHGLIDQMDARAIGLLTKGFPFVADTGPLVPSQGLSIRGLLSADESALVLAIPLATEGCLTRFFAIARPETAPWEKDDIDVVRAIVERVWSSLDACRAQVALKAERDESRHIFLNLTSSPP
jgi:GAF domain-containing protein